MTKNVVVAVFGAAAVSALCVAGAAAAPREQLSERVTVVAWVDADAINMTPLERRAKQKVRAFFDGMDRSDLDQEARKRCMGFLARLFVTSGLASNTLPNYISPKNAEADSAYAQAMLLKSSANEEPPRTISDDYIRTADYRLINDFQIVFSPVFASRAPRHLAAVGRTPIPCGLKSEEGLPDVIKEWATDTDAHSEMHGKRLCSQKLDTVMQVSQGRLGRIGRNIQRLLSVTKKPASQLTPWIWAGVEFNKAGKLLPLRKQVFPTYYVYINGKMDPVRSSTRQPNVADFLNPGKFEYRKNDFDVLSKPLSEGGCQ